MTERFIRDYRLQITTGGRETIIQPPVRISFDARKSISGGLNKINLRIYNLSEARRLRFVKDFEESKDFPLSLYVGYKDRRELVFKGTISVASNRRSGSDIVTEIQSLDGGFDLENAFTSKTVLGGEVAVLAVIADMTRIEAGAISDRPVLTRPKVLVGNSVKLIQELLQDGETAYIDDEKLFILKNDEVTSNFLPLITAKSGLIGTPTRDSSRVTFKMLIDPTIKIGRVVALRSMIAPHLNGIYRLEDIEYQGDTYGSEWSQTCTGMLAGDYRVMSTTHG